MGLYWDYSYGDKLEVNNISLTMEISEKKNRAVIECDLI